MAYVGNNLTVQQYAPQIAYFSGNGSTTVFTLPVAVVSAAQIIVAVDNVIQNPSSAFSVSGTTITFTSAPLTGTNNIWVEYTSLQTNLIQPANGTVNTAQLGTITNISSGNSALTLQTGATPTTAITIDASQKVGVGNAIPAAKLDVAGTLRSTTNTTPASGAGLEVLYATGTGGLLTCIDRSTTTWQDLYLQGQTNIFYTAGTERMRIDSSGKVLINTTANAVGARFAISETANASWGQSLVLGNTTNGTVYTNTSGTANYLAIGFYNNGTSYSNAGAISVSGSTTTYATSSDYRLKENIAPMQNALNVVQQLKPVTYKWKIDGSSGQGFIAHELQAVVPDCVTGEKDAVDEEGKIIPQMIDTSFLVATLTAAIQELNAKVTALEAKLEAK
jgi:hypothetical protein